MLDLTVGLLVLVCPSVGHRTRICSKLVRFSAGINSSWSSISVSWFLTGLDSDAGEMLGACLKSVPQSSGQEMNWGASKYLLSLIARVISLVWALGVAAVAVAVGNNTRQYAALSPLNIIPWLWQTKQYGRVVSLQTPSLSGRKTKLSQL